MKHSMYEETTQALDMAAKEADQMEKGASEYDLSQMARVVCLVGRAICIELSGIKQSLENSEP